MKQLTKLILFTFCSIAANMAQAMNKAELIDAISARSGLDADDSTKALEAAIESITDALQGGQQVSIVGFGTFSTKEM